MPIKIDLLGQRFNRLTVTGYNRTDPNGKVWNAVCDCGSQTEATTSMLTTGNTKSCGCFRSEYVAAKNFIHGHTKACPSTYGAYINAKRRCEDPENPRYHRYGGRGIRFLFSSIDELVEEIGYRPASDLSLDRIDNDGNYKPGNVRWATRLIQARNK